VRKLRFFEPRQYVSIDYARRDLLVISVDSQAGPLPAELAAALAAGKINSADLAKFAAAGAASTAPELTPGLIPGLTPGFKFIKPEVAPGEPLRLEILSFLESVRTRRPPKVTARQGRAALELALQIQSAMAAHADRAGLGDFFKAGP
jgi:hypothetical protein